MATKTFDKDIILDFTVNMVPLTIILFFMVALTFVNLFGFESLISGLQYMLLIASFVLLVVLTHLSEKAIAGLEKEGTVYAPDRTMVPGAKLFHGKESEGAVKLEESSTDDAVGAAGKTT